MSDKKISVIIPVYNMARYLNETISSWTSQKLQGMEFIYINDASNDDSREVLERWSEKDKRIRIINFEKNSGPWSARIEGVKRATGRYIMFADADDSISPDACTELYQLMNRHHVDILHFSTRVINANQAEHDTIKLVENFVKPYYGRLTGNRVLRGCFEEEKYRFSLWNKIYNSSVVKLAISHMQDVYMSMAEDKLAYFIISYYAKSYIGVKTKACYNYYYGRGGFGETNFTIKSFERFCSGGLAADQLSLFLNQNSSESNFRSIEEKFRRELIENCLWNFTRNVKEQDKAKCFDMMLSYFRPDEISAAFREYAGDSAYSLSSVIKNAEVLQFDRREIKTIGVYYYSIVNGGLERVLCTLAKLWTTMGYKVVVFTDTYPDQNDYALPPSVERIVIPGCMTNDIELYKKHAAALYEALRNVKIDLFVYHAWISRNIFWDGLIIKSSGAAFIPHCHSTFGILFQQEWPDMTNILSAYIIADAVVALSEMDMEFWKNFNQNVWKVQNPFFSEPAQWKASDCNNHDIVWVGRISGEKNPEELIQIIDLIREKVPDAKLNIVGGGDSEYIDKIKHMIDERNLSNHVTLHGFQKNVMPFYQTSSVFLLTSEYEGFPLALQESMMAGIPTVMYELPYLTLVKDNPAVISVKQHSVRDAAEAITALLRNDETRKELGSKARDFIESMSQYDYEKVWDEIFSSTRKEHEEKSAEDLLMMQFIISNHGALTRTKAEGIRYSDRKVAKMAFLFLKALDTYRYKGMKYILNKGTTKVRTLFRK